MILIVKPKNNRTMKPTFLFLLSTLLLTACQPAAEPPAEAAPPAVDMEQATKEVQAAMDRFQLALKNKDVAAMGALMAEGSMLCGTDPGELWDKAGLLEVMEQMAADETLQINYTVDTQKIRLAADGQSAIVLEQMAIDFISPHIPIRQVFYLVKSGDGWQMDFVSSSLVPANEDLAKINQAFN